MHDIMREATTADLERITRWLETAKIILRAAGQADYIAALEAHRTKIRETLEIIDHANRT